MYQNSPRKIVENFGLKWSKYKNQVLGGETAMWSEQVILKIIFNESLLYQKFKCTEKCHIVFHNSLNDSQISG